MHPNHFAIFVQMQEFKSGFVGIFGKPNAGKSTLMNALLGEKLAIVSPKAQTTRNKILGILSTDTYQIVFSDTPGIIEAKYKLHEKMMSEVELAKQGNDVILYLLDATDDLTDNSKIIESIKQSAPILLVVNKIDKVKDEKIAALKEQAKNISLIKEVLFVSALKKTQLDQLLERIVKQLPAMPAYYDAEAITDRPMRFFVAEMIREKLFFLLDKELPYHSAVIVRAFEEKNTLTKIQADIIVGRETQKAIILGKGGEMIKKIGQQSREDIEKFIDRKVFLELHVKVRKDWRNNNLYLKEYGY